LLTGASNKKSGGASYNGVPKPEWPVLEAVPALGARFERAPRSTAAFALEAGWMNAAMPQCCPIDHRHSIGVMMELDYGLAAGAQHQVFGREIIPRPHLPSRTRGKKHMLINFRVGFATALIVATALASTARAETPSPPGAVVYFINLKDGDSVTSPFKVQFGLAGMGVAPAGSQNPNTGHHHLLIDTQLTAEQMKQPIPVDAQHRHFGGGQTEVALTLPPGPHTLQLVLGDGAHAPHEPPVVSPVVHVTVK
jgi:hypothetical protein